MAGLLDFLYNEYTPKYGVIPDKDIYQNPLLSGLGNGSFAPILPPRNIGPSQSNAPRLPQPTQSGMLTFDPPNSPSINVPASPENVMAQDTSLPGNVAQETPQAIDPKVVSNSGGILGALNDPVTMGLLSAAASLLESSGPSPTPISLGQAIGRAGMSGIKGVTGAQNYQMQNMLRKAQLEKALKDNDSEIIRTLRASGIPKDKWPSIIEAKFKNSGSGGNPYFTPVQTANGVYAFNARTGKMELINADGGPVVGSGSDPRLQGAIAKAKQAGESAAKREYNMEGIGSVIQQADDLLSGISRDESGVARPGKLPTGSGVGAGYDWLAGQVGMSPSGAVEAQKLKAIGGALTSKMPRMEGPQSDRDTQLYREMAAMVGDPTVPVDRRKAALQSVKDLWAKYGGGGRTSVPPPPAGFKLD